MKKLSLVLALAMLLSGGVVAATSGPSSAQGYYYPPPPQNISGTPWVGPNTPWVFYNGDWFLNGLLYHFFGTQYGWAPYYAYAPTYIVRPQYWYGPRWQTWYQGHPRYWETFHRAYPYWVGHRQGQFYDRRFYDQHHRGQGGGWHKGFHRSGTPDRFRSDDRRGGRDHDRGRSGDDDRGRHGGDDRGGHGGGHH